MALVKFVQPTSKILDTKEEEWLNCFGGSRFYWFTHITLQISMKYNQTKTWK